MVKIYFLSLCLVVSHCMHAQTTYAWNLAGGGDWQIASNWSSVPGGLPRTVPAADDILVFTTVSGSITNVPTQTIGQLTINSSTVDQVAAAGGVTLTVTGAVTVNAGSLLAFNATLAANSAVTIDGSYQINQGGWATGSGTWTYGAAGTLIFNNSSGVYDINNDVFWPAVNGPVNITAQNTGEIRLNVPRTVSGLFQTGKGVRNSNNLTFNGTCQINSGGFLDLAPTYGASSTLVYNAGIVYNRGNEWSATSGPGYPANVTINAGTALNLGYGGTGTPRQLSGNLLLNGGLFMDFGTDDMTEALTVLGNVTIGSTGTLSLSDQIGGDIKVLGNWNLAASGIFNPRNRTVSFNGSTGNQTITGATTFDYLILDNSTGNLILNSPITCTQLLTLTNGKIVTTATNLLTFIDNASYAGGSVNSFVEGPMKKIGDEDFIFPVGLGGIYAPLGLTDGTGATTTDEFTVQYLRTNPQSVYGSSYSGGINHVSFVEHWTIVRAGAATKKVSLDVHQTSFCLQPSTTFVSRHNGSVWTNEPSTATGFGACGSYQCGTITTQNPISSFSPFTLATTDPFAINPLPIKLISFNAIKVNDRQNRLLWTLADNCSDDVRFEIQASENNSGFRTLFSLPGSVSSRTYSYNDNRLRQADVYYRLKITEPSGNIIYSHLAAILQNSNDLLVTQLWPNPVTDRVQLTISSGSNMQGRVILLNMAGQVVLEQSITLAEGSRILELDLSHLPSGIYQGRVQGNLQSTGFRLVKK